LNSNEQKKPIDFSDNHHAVKLLIEQKKKERLGSIVWIALGFAVGFGVIFVMRS
jgi:hypothetical protein